MERKIAMDTRHLIIFNPGNIATSTGRALEVTFLHQAELVIQKPHFVLQGGGGGIPGREIVLEIQGGDALFVDKIYFDVWYGQETFCDTHDEFSVGGDNEIAWCLSTDPSDGDNSHAYQSRCANALKINLEDRTVEYLDV